VVYCNLVDAFGDYLRVYVHMIPVTTMCYSDLCQERKMILRIEPGLAVGNVFES